MNKAITKGFLCILITILSVISVSAKGINTDEAKQIHKNTNEAIKFLNQIIKTSESKEEIQKAEATIKSLKKIITTVEKHVDISDIYNGGTKYPGISSVSLESFEVPVGAKVVHVPVKLNKPSPNTVIAHIRVFNGKGGRANPDARKSVIFRPGEQLVKSVSFKIHPMKEGQNVKANQHSVPDGGKRAGSTILVTAKEGAVNEPIVDESKPMTFEPLGDICYSATGETIKFDDKGGSMSFSTALPHGRTQVGNKETGYYGTIDMGGFIRNGEKLVLSTRRLDKSVKVGTPAMEYPFLAAMLSGHRTPEAQFKYGSIEWDVKMPNRFGSWPALWLLPKSGWPPEIDVYEGFGYNGSWKFSSCLSSNIHGGKNLVRSFTRPAMFMKMSDFGLKSTLDSEFHKFAVTVDEEWITMFVDNIETMRYANPFKGQTWFPLTNVAVKAKMKSLYDKGSGDMTIRSIKIWRKE